MQAEPEQQENLNNVADILLEATDRAFPNSRVMQFQVLVLAMTRWTAKYQGVVDLISLGIGALVEAREAAERFLASKKPS